MGEDFEPDLTDHEILIIRQLLADWDRGRLPAALLLSPKERQVQRLQKLGFSRSEIAKKLDLPEVTIRTISQRILQKLPPTDL